MFNRQLVFGRLLFTLCVVAISLGANPVEAAKRVALLIGNSQYQASTALRNPPNDVALMKKTFEDAGFDDVEVAIDVDLVGMRKALRSFEDKAYGAEVAVLYYSGHGMEMNGQNYLIPVDAVLQSDKDVEDETIPLDRAQRALDGATRLKLIILDACRNNPFLETMSRSIGSRAIQKGLAKIEPESADMLVAYASKAGTVAMDGAGNNSPFATALSKYLTQPGVDVRIALGQVRDEVVKITARSQEPFVYGSLGGAQIFLNIKELNITINNNADTKTGKDQEASPNGMSEAAADWQNIRDLADKELLEAFIAKHGKDPVYKMLAEKKLKQLEQAAQKDDIKADQIAWEALKGSKDPAALKRFIDRYPDSPFRTEAEAQVAMLTESVTTDNGASTASAAEKDCYLLAGEPGSQPGFAGVAFNKIDAARALTACQQAVNEKPNDGALLNMLGRAQDAGRNYPEARKAYEAAAKNGNLYAMVNLAWFPIYGIDEAVDVEKGRQMLEKAAISGNPVAQASLAWLYRDGYGGVTQDYDEAFKWYSQAADQGNALAIGNLGWFYREGHSVPQDYVKSLTYYRKAADLGDINSIAAMGYAAQNGLGMAQDYDAARQWYEKGAEQADAYSMASLGFLYDAGYGVKQDYVEARYWYEKAADAGSAYAMANLSRLHDQGLGTRVDPKEAVRWAIAAIERGDQGKLDELKTTPDNVTAAFRTELQQQLASRGLYSGTVDGEMNADTIAALDKLATGQTGVPDNTNADQNATDDKPADDKPADNQTSVTTDDKITDPGVTTSGDYTFRLNTKSTTPEADQCYKLAGEPNSEPDFQGVTFVELQADAAIEACSRAIDADGKDSMLFDMLGRAYDVKADYPKAKANYNRALEMGNVWSLTNLAWLTIYGNGEPQDVEKGMDMLRAAAGANNPFAQSSLGWIYREGYGGVTQDYEKAFDWYEKAADLGYANAQASLGWLYREGLGTEKDLRASLEWYRKGAEGGDVNAMGSVGYALQNGLGEATNYEEAFKWFQKGAERNDSYCMASLAWHYENGNGVKVDYRKAKFWYTKAADAGSTYAMGNLSLMYDQGKGTAQDLDEAGRLAFASIQGGEQTFINDMKAGATAYSPEFRMQIQRLLKDRDLYDGPIDGIFGATTAKAIDQLAKGG